jgi:hypothetical protein
MSEKFNALKASGDLDRIELLGDNCELGNLFVACGYTGGSLFRFVFNPPESLLKALQDDFKHLFLIENLSPLPWGMVSDSAYNMHFHTSILKNGGDGYVLDRSDETVSTHSSELEKYAYLKARFFDRAKSGTALYIIKCNNGIPKDVMSGIEKELSRLSRGKPFVLLEVRKAEKEAQRGQVKYISRHRAVGWIRSFADYSTATDLPDADGWIDVIDTALHMRSFPVEKLREIYGRLLGKPARYLIRLARI